MADSGYWQFCDIVERTKIPGPTLATPAETERVVLERHTETGECRVRPLGVVMTEADDG
jgi:stress response protein YsnF